MAKIAVFLSQVWVDKLWTLGLSLDALKNVDVMHSSYGVFKANTIFRT